MLGKTIEVGTHQVTIVGVTPPSFAGLQVGSAIDVTIPMGLAGTKLRSHQTPACSSLPPAIATLAGVLFSIAPAVRSARTPSTRAASGWRTATPRVGLGQSLTVVQVMFSVVLLCGAGLFARTLHNLTSIDAGFDSRDVLTMQVEATMPDGIGGPSDVAQSAADHARLGSMWEHFVARVTALPDVASAGVATMTPLTGRDRGGLIGILGTRVADEDRYSHVNQVTAGYFDTMGTDVVAGRAFDSRDRATAPRVAILNETESTEGEGTQRASRRIRTESLMSGALPVG